jgi:hypothetical protein
MGNSCLIVVTSIAFLYLSGCASTLRIKVVDSTNESSLSNTKICVSTTVNDLVIGSHHFTSAIKLTRTDGTSEITLWPLGSNVVFISREGYLDGCIQWGESSEEGGLIVSPCDSKAVSNVVVKQVTLCNSRALIVVRLFRTRNRMRETKGVGAVQ